MDDNLAWTTQLGEAFASQQADVMDSIQRLRAKAQALGNLQSTPQETVESDGGDIDIDPADPNDIYVPDYQPHLIYEESGCVLQFRDWFSDWSLARLRLGLAESSFDRLGPRP